MYRALFKALSQEVFKEAVSESAVHMEWGRARKAHEERTVVALWLNAWVAGKEGTVERDHKEAKLTHTALLV